LTTVAEFFNAYRAATQSLDSLAALDEVLESARLYCALAGKREGVTRGAPTSVPPSRSMKASSRPSIS
jgi:hypothetical protein